MAEGLVKALEETVQAEIDNKCLELISEAEKLHELANAAHSKSEAKRYKCLAEGKEEEAVKLKESNK